MKTGYEDPVYGSGQGSLQFGGVSRPDTLLATKQADEEHDQCGLRLTHWSAALYLRNRWL